MTFTLFMLIDIICGVSSGLFSLAVTKRFLVVRQNKFYHFLLLCAHLLAANMIIYIGDPVNILGTLPFFIAGILFCCEGSLLTRISLSMVIFTLVISLNVVIDYFIDIDIRILARMICWLLIWLFVSRTMPITHQSIPTRLWMLLDVMALMPFSATMAAVTLTNLEIKVGENLPPLIIMPFAALSSLGLLAAVVLLTQHEQLEQEQTLWQMRSLYYQNLEQEQLKVRRLRHDMANHLQVMAGLDEQASRSYLNDLIASPAMNTSRRFCKNEVVNVVLSSKSAQMEDDKIRAQIQVSIPDKVSIADIDLCGLFANSLDNAIEACLKLPEENRYLSLQAQANKGLLVLQVKNSMKGIPLTKNGHILTSKTSPVKHGLGLTIIREISERYNGSVDITYTEDTFTLIASLPL